MKTKPLTLLLIVASLLFASCHRTAQGAQSDNQSTAELSWGETDIVAVAFVGYCTSFDDFRATPAYADLCKRYALPNDVPFIDHTGDELFLVIPRDPNASVAVNDLPSERLIDPDADVYGPILYKSEEGPPFFIKCQSSGGMTNAEIIIVDNNKHELTYRPQLSTDDGSLMTPGIVGPGEGSVLDITQPLPKSSLPQAIDFPDKLYRAEIRNGRPIIIVNTCTQDIDEGPHFIERISGRCIGIYLSTIGDLHPFKTAPEAEAEPWIFMLMEDGGVEVFAHSFLSLTNIDERFISSGRLPNLKDITSFRTEGSGSINTVYAIDKAGARHEIRPCFLPTPYRELYCYAEGKEHELCIYPTWKIKYNIGKPAPPEMPFGKDLETYLGRLLPTKMDPKAGVYEFFYDMFAYLDHTKEESSLNDRQPPSSLTRGSFRLTTKDGGKSYEMTVLSGPLSFGCAKGAPARYTIIRLDENGKPLFGEE